MYHLLSTQNKKAFLNQCHAFSAFCFRPMSAFYSCMETSTKPLYIFTTLLSYHFVWRHPPPSLHIYITVIISFCMETSPTLSTYLQYCYHIILYGDILHLHIYITVISSFCMETSSTRSTYLHHCYLIILYGDILHPLYIFTSLLSYHFVWRHPPPSLHIYITVISSFCMETSPSYSTYLHHCCRIILYGDILHPLYIFTSMLYHHFVWRHPPPTVHIYINVISSFCMETSPTLSTYLHHCYHIILYGDILHPLYIFTSLLSYHFVWRHPPPTLHIYITVISSFCMETSSTHSTYLHHCYHIILYGDIPHPLYIFTVLLSYHFVWRHPPPTLHIYVNVISSFCMETSPSHSTYLHHCYIIILYGDILQPLYIFTSLLYHHFVWRHPPPTLHIYSTVISPFCMETSSTHSTYLQHCYITILYGDIPHPLYIFTALLSHYFL